MAIETYNLWKKLLCVITETYNFWKQRGWNSLSAWRLKPTTSDNKEEETAYMHGDWNLQLLKTKRKKLLCVTVETYNFWKQIGKRYSALHLKPTTSEYKEEKTAFLHGDWNLQLLKTKRKSYSAWQLKPTTSEYRGKKLLCVTVETYNFWIQRGKKLLCVTVETYNFWKQIEKSYSAWQLKPTTSENKEERSYSAWRLKPTTSENKEERSYFA